MERKNIDKHLSFTHVVSFRQNRLLTPVNGGTVLLVLITEKHIDQTQRSKTRSTYVKNGVFLKSIFSFLAHVLHRFISCIFPMPQHKY
jgi:hypothetical protein